MRTTTPLFDGLLDSWMLALEAANKSPRTVENYAEGVTRLATWLREHDHRDDVTALTAEQLRSWLVDLANAPGRTGATTAESTVRGRYIAVKLFLNWCRAEGELDTDPMANIPQPKVSERVAPMLDTDSMQALLRDCSGTAFSDLRDRAIVMLLGDSGLRVSEVAGIHLPDLDLRERHVRVIGKGNRERTVPFGRATAAALDKYLRARRRRKYADRDWLWLSSTDKGLLTVNGIQQALRKRGNRLGFHLHPHMFRHGFAHAWLASGGSEGDLMELAGWRTRQMLLRYGAAQRSQRARDAYRDRSPMDNL